MRPRRVLITGVSRYLGGKLARLLQNSPRQWFKTLLVEIAISSQPDQERQCSGCGLTAEC